MAGRTRMAFHSAKAIFRALFAPTPRLQLDQDIYDHLLEQVVKSDRHRDCPVCKGSGTAVMVGDEMMLCALCHEYSTTERVEEKFTLGEIDGERYIECNTCEMRSFNPDDIKYKYCDNCGVFHHD